MFTRKTVTLALALGAAVLGGAAVHAVSAERSLAPDSRCFEMRTYYPAAGKMEALHARFRDHTVQLFKKHGMTQVGYWVTLTKEGAPEDKLVYLLAFPSREAREKAFAAFGRDPEWVAARNASEVNGKLVDRVESVLMTATDYSAMK